MAAAKIGFWVERREKRRKKGALGRREGWWYGDWRRRKGGEGWLVGEALPVLFVVFVAFLIPTANPQRV